MIIKKRVIKKMLPTRKKQYLPYRRVGDEAMTQEMDVEKRSTWICVAIIVGSVCGLVLVASMILSVTFSGIAAFKDLSVTVNSTTPLTEDDQQLKLDITAIIDDVINSITDTGTCKNICSNGCYSKFYVCPYDATPDECGRRSLILKDCDNFINCLGECNLAFGTCNTHMEDVQDFSGSCINKYNRELICPK